MTNEFSISAKDFSIELLDIITKVDLIWDVVLVCGDEKIADFIGPDIRGVGLFLWDIVEDLETIYDTLYPEVDDATVKRLIKQYKGRLEEPEATASPETAT